MAEILVALTLLGIVIASILLWSRVVNAQKTQQPHILSPRDWSITPLGFVDVIVVFLIQMLFQSIGMIPVFLLTNTRAIDTSNVQQMTAFNFFVGAASIIAAVASMAWLGGRYQDRPAAGWNPKMLLADIKLGCYGFLLFVPPVLLLQSALTQIWDYEHATMNLITPESPLLTILSAWLMATIVAPLNEEVLFRVVLLGWLLRCFANPHDMLGGLLGGRSTDKPVSHLQSPPPASPTAHASYEHKKTWPPLFIVALLFALAHLGQGPAPIPIFFLGFGLCFLYRQTGSLVPCVVTHYLLNTFSMAVYTIEQFNLPAEEASPAPASVINSLTFFLQP